MLGFIIGVIAAACIAIWISDHNNDNNQGNFFKTA